MSEKLFAYGTLRPPTEHTPPEDSRYYPEIADRIRAHQPASIDNATLFDLGAYPALLAGDTRVHGDLLTVDAATLEIADRIEGHPIFYQRKMATVNTAEGPTEAWIYWAPEELVLGRSIIANGDWFRRREAGHMAQAEAYQPDAGAVDPLLRQAVTRFAESDCSWMSTTRPDGRPHIAPMWHVWFHGRVYVVTPEMSVKMANIAQNPNVSLSHPDPSDVIIIDGWAIEMTEMIETVQPLFQEKYHWDITTDAKYNRVIEIAPLKLMTWNNSPVQRWRSAEILQVW